MTIIMNVIKNFIASLFLLAFSAVAFAAATPSISIFQAGGEKKVSVQIEDLPTSATIYLKDADGLTLVSENIKGGSSFGKTLNLQNLPAGDYQIVIAAGMRETVQPLTLTNKAVIVDPARRQVFFAPVINVKDDLVDISWLGNRLGNVTVAILNDAGAVVFEEQIKNVLTVSRRYNIADLEKGGYIVKVGTDYKSYYQDLDIR